MKPIRTTGAACSLTLMLALLSSAHAQEDPIAACQRAVTPEARIACLEDALRRQSAPQPAAQPSTPSQSAPEREESRSAMSRVGGAIGALNPFSGGGERESTGQVSSRDNAADRFGAEQVAARNAPPRSQSDAQQERLAARVASVSTVPYQRLEVTLDNGQVWRQIAGDNQRITERHANGSSVEIWEARLGGYQMRLNEISRTIRVERIR